MEAAAVTTPRKAFCRGEILDPVSAVSGELAVPVTSAGEPGAIGRNEWKEENSDIRKQIG